MNIKQIKALLEGNPSEQEVEELRQDERIGVHKLLEGYYKKKKAILVERERFEVLLKYEKAFYQEGYSLIAGIDEAGRGPLAGPLVVAAVVLPKNVFISGLDDSKKISASKRNRLYQEVLEKALSIAVSIVSVADIDKYNIYMATKRSMENITKYLTWAPDAILVDAMPIEVPSTKVLSLIHGDALSASIAAASIIAKVTRDELMERIHMEYPQYAFQSNKGYGSKEHMEALKKYGITCWHRQSFEPVKSMCKAGSSCITNNKSEFTKLK
ncbi:MAG TPA: ribonuclease HII [Candidatus Avacidaminococcus intestinavium]|uniref:Ribonuclease HII n=1 Tax=Candidatus Avacidaminococcus intestinavium TaxID=2840684 RepID=A0A9D1SKY9_9FIRM|nr:ribonuclease HII [Candidatus Avacidaminococcus intestinavium]